MTGVTAGKAWAAEHAVDLPQATALIAAAAPELTGLPTSLVGQGWDDVVVGVDDRWAFRFPRRGLGVQAAAREVLTLTLLAQVAQGVHRLPVPVPDVRWTSPPRDGFPSHYWGGRMLPGTELARRPVSATQRVQVATDVGAALRRLHDPAIAAAVQADGRLPHDPMARSDAAARAAMTRTLLSSVPLEPELDDAVAALLSRADALPGRSTAAEVLVHGDLHVRHVLVADGRCSGLIDWGDACLADPALDLSLAFGGFQGAEREAFLAAYAPPGSAASSRASSSRLCADTELRARTLAACIGAALGAQAADAEDCVMLAEARRILRRSVSP